MSKTSAKIAAKKPKVKPKISAKSVSNRKLKTPKYKTFRLHKRVGNITKPLPYAFHILWRSLTVLKNYWKLFLGITIVYGFLNIILVRGLSGSTDLSSVKTSLEHAFKGSGGKVSTGLTLFVYLLGSSGNSSNANAGVYQTILIIIVSLATIWALRQVYLRAKKVRIRDAFYKGMSPLISFVIVLLVIGLQLLPLLIGAVLYSTVIGDNIAVYAVEKILWALLFALLALFSLYMLCSSLFALYISTLPDMTPMKALRSARQLVLHRRLRVLLKLLFLPFALLILAAIIMFPLILFATSIAPWMFFLLSMAGLIIVNSYMYVLYRELLE